MTVAHTPASKALFKALIPPDPATTTARSDALYEAVAPFHEVLATAAVSFAKIERLCRAADAVEENPQVYAFFEQIRQTCAGVAREIATTTKSLDRICDASWGLDQRAREIESSLARPGGTGHAAIGGTLAPLPDRRAPDQDTAVEGAFVEGTLPEKDRRTDTP